MIRSAGILAAVALALLACCGCAEFASDHEGYWMCQSTSSFSMDEGCAFFWYCDNPNTPHLGVDGHAGASYFRSLSCRLTTRGGARRYVCTCEHDDVQTGQLTDDDICERVPDFGWIEQVFELIKARGCGFPPLAGPGR